MNLRAARAALLGQPRLRGAALRAALTAAADEFLGELLGAEPGVALVAVGGYGRKELVAGSDLDLLLVHAGRRDAAAVADRVFYPVWDAGVSLDHSVRNVSESRAVARSDLKAALGMLHLRLVAGEADLAHDLRRGVLADWRADAPRRLAELGEMLRERAQRMGELAYLLEPDLKEARGGLRDVHALQAAAAAWVLDAPAAPIREAYEFLLDVRGELHRRTGRPGDRLVLQEQDGLAAELGLADGDALLSRVSAAGRAISYAVDVGWRRVAAVAAPSPRRWRRPAAPPPRRPLAEGVVEQSGEVVLARVADPGADPALTLRVAAAAAEAQLPVAPHTLERLVAESAPLPEPWPEDARQAFFRLIGSGVGSVTTLEALDQAGLLERLLPEWSQVRCRPQRNALHRFTVDRHLIEAAVQAATLAGEVDRPDLLVLGAFLHDIGKGRPGDHSAAGVPVAAGICARLGLPGEDLDTVTLLVRHHLLLADTATRRDLDDPATISLVAEAVGDRSVLAVLYRLTEADGRATGPAAWGDWKAGLVADLVRRVDERLAGAAVPVPRPAPALPDDVAAAVEVGAPAVLVHALPVGHRVSVVGPDRPGRLWRYAGVLALHRLDVKAATATSVGPVAVSMFEVTVRFGGPPSWESLRTDLLHVDTLPVAERLAERERAYSPARPASRPSVIRFDDTGSQHATIVEVHAPDSVGLLYRLGRTLAEAGLDVRSARVATIGAEAVDSFYVTEVGGGRLPDGDRREALTRALQGAVGEERR